MKFEAAITTRVGKGSSAPRLVKRAANVGMTFSRMTATTIAAIDDDGDRVDQRRADLRAQLDGLLDVDREALEDRVEDTARLAGGDHVDVEVVERLRVAAHRVGERRARLDVLPHLEQDLLRSSCAPAGCARISRHCTSGRPASIMTENWRVKTASVFGGTLRPIFVSEISLPRSRMPVTTMFWRRSGRERDFLRVARRGRPPGRARSRLRPFQT